MANVCDDKQPIAIPVTCHLGADLHVLQQHRQRLQVLCCPASLHLCQLAVHLTETLTIQPAHTHTAVTMPKGIVF